MYNRLCVPVMQGGRVSPEFRTGTPVTTKPYLPLPEHHGFNGSEKNSACFRHALPLLIKVYAKQVHSQDSDKAGNREAVEVIKAFVKEMVALALKRTKDSRNVPTRACSCVDI